MKKIHSLSFKIPFFTISLIFILIIILGLASIISSGRSIRKTALEGFNSTILGYSYMLDMILHEQKLAISTYSQVPIIQEGILYPNDESVQTALLAALKKLSSVNEYTINLGIADTNGNIILDDTNPKLSGLSLYGDHADLMTTIKERNYEATYDNQIVISSTTGDPAILACIGVRDSRDNIIGLVYLNLDLNKINSDFIDNVPFDGIITIVNNKNMERLLSSDSDRIGQKISSSNFDIIKSSSNGVIESYTSDIDKVKKTLAYTRMSEMPWTVMLSKNDAEIYKEVKKTFIRTLIIAPAGILLISFFIFIYTNTITKPLMQLTLIAKEISEGDLVNKKLNIKRNDELGELANSFLNIKYKLSSVITKVRMSADEISIGSKELSQASIDLSNRTESQAASLEETASSMEEMASTIKSSTEQAVEGNNMMINSREAIKNACSTILETTSNIEKVNEASNKIKDITKIIEDIAFQTNILALNAAVEAARAGDMGKGFAVVASEVRNLAQTTQSSVKDITHLVDNAYDKINKATESARVSQDIFNDLQQKIENTARIMQDISSTAVEQNKGVEQVNRAVADMDTVTQQNAALAEEASASSNSLLSQTEELVRSMKFFKV